MHSVIVLIELTAEWWWSFSNEVENRVDASLCRCSFCRTLETSANFLLTYTESLDLLMLDVRLRSVGPLLLEYGGICGEACPRLSPSTYSPKTFYAATKQYNKYAVHSKTNILGFINRPI